MMNVFCAKRADIINQQSNLLSIFLIIIYDSIMVVAWQHANVQVTDISCESECV